MATKKFYPTIINGTLIDIFDNWGECEKAVKGVKGAAFKSFKTESEALEFAIQKVKLLKEEKNDIGSLMSLFEDSKYKPSEALLKSFIKTKSETTSKKEAVQKASAPKKSAVTTNSEKGKETKAGTKKSAKTKAAVSSKKQQNNEESLEIYIDGSYSKQRNMYTYGLSFKTEDGFYDENGFGLHEDVATMFQVGGELMGSIAACKYALRNHISDITICYDYKGIECWATGEWKRNNPHTRAYHAEMQVYMKHLNIDFKKIAAHSGHEMNDRADMLAKQAMEL